MTNYIDNIKNLLRSRGITHQELADRAGVSINTVRRLLLRGGLSVATLQRWAEALGVPVWLLLTTQEDARAYLDSLTPSRGVGAADSSTSSSRADGVSTQEGDASRGGVRCPHCGGLLAIVPGA